LAHFQEKDCEIGYNKAMNIKQLILDGVEESALQEVPVQSLATRLGVKDANEYKKMVIAIADLEAEGKLTFKANGSIALVSEEAVVKPEKAKKAPDFAQVTGVFRANANGFGFVTVDSDEPDVFIPKGKTAFAMEGDKVLVSLTKPANPLHGTAAEGRVAQIETRAVTSAVGKFTAYSKEDEELSNLIGYVETKDKKMPYRIYLTAKGIRPETDELVRVEVTHYPDKEFPTAMEGFAVEVIGNINDQGIDVLEVLESMGISSAFPQSVLDQANAVPGEVSDDEAMGRLDFRNETIFTIDGEDAKDLDDAVHIKLLDNGNYELGVHIADVSYYVTEGSPLDKEAFDRGTSVYVTDRVVPMLPERLSNGIASLNPRVNRLTMSAVMEINRQGKVVDYQIGPSIIKTVERMTYTDVNRIIDGDAEAVAQYQDIYDSVMKMADLHTILMKMRTNRGSIDFDTEEAKIIVDEKGMPVEIVNRTRGTAERLIESFMLIANETVAQHFATANLPFIYRIHEHPKAEKLTRFIDFASTFGIPFKGTSDKVAQQDLQAFMNKIKGQPGEMVLSTMLLRSMQQARYSEHNAGHFGLAAEYYTHFTSPIRRYPDLIVHRLIRALAKPTAKTLQHFEEVLPEIATQSSSRERRAVDAEREVEKMKKAEYMMQHVGETYQAVVSSTTRFGMFAELPNTIEGLIHISTLTGQYFTFNERTLALQGEKTGLTFRIGQPIMVNVVKADKITGEIDFEYVPNAELDVIEKVSSKTKKKDKKREGDRKRDTSKSHDKKAGKKPFYSKVAKDASVKPKKKGGGKNGQGSRKRRRTK
jgi:ribonuclease R